MRAPTRWMAILAAYSLLLSQALAAQQTATGTLKIPDATIIRLALLDSLSSATNQVDDPVNLEVTEDVKVGDLVAIPKGSTARGHVVEVEPKKRLGRAGKLNFTLDNVKAPDGSNVRLRASSARKGEDKSGTVIVGTMLLSGLFLLMHGKDVNIPKGTAFNAYVDGDREIALGGQPGALPSPTRAPAQPVSRPAAPAPPTMVLTDPSIGNSGETIDVTASTISVRGVVMDPSGLPAVTVNGAPAGLLPKGPQAAQFSSEPIRLQPGENRFEVVATNAAHLQTKIDFVARLAHVAPAPTRTVAQSKGRGLAKSDVLALLNGGVPSQRVAELVGQRGINFSPNDDDFSDIRAAGGRDDLVSALRQAPARAMQ